MPIDPIDQDADALEPKHGASDQGICTPSRFLVERRSESKHGRDPADRRIGCCAHAWVAPDEATARREWEPRYRAYVEWVNELFRVSSGLTDGQGLGAFDFEERLRTIAICGTPAQAVDRIRSWSNGAPERVLNP